MAIHTTAAIPPRVVIASMGDCHVSALVIWSACAFNAHNTPAHAKAAVRLTVDRLNNGRAGNSPARQANVTD